MQDLKYLQLTDPHCVSVMTGDNDSTSGALAASEFGQQHGEQQPQGNHRSIGTITAPMELQKMSQWPAGQSVKQKSRFKAFQNT